MTPRSPRYPGIGLEQAVKLVEKLHRHNRTNIVDREAASKDLGFSGVTGSSTKALADLTHYGLIEKSGKGAVRVSHQTVDILYPHSPNDKATALREAAFKPDLFADLRAHFQDGVPSENALKGYLIRQQFVSAAIPIVITSYLETCRFIQQLAENESDGQPAPPVENAARDASGGERTTDNHQRVESPPPQMNPGRPLHSVQADRPMDGVKLMSSERELTTGLLSKQAGFRLIVHGKIGEKEIDRLIRKLQLDKEILAENDDSFPQTPNTAEH